MGKGSKSRITDKKAFDANYDEIQWLPGIECFDCGAIIKKENLETHPENYIVYKDD